MLFMVPRINIDSKVTYVGTKFMLLTATFRPAPTGLVLEVCTGVGVQI